MMHLLDYLDFEITESPCSEYEMYFNYIQIYHQDNHNKRKLKWKNTSCINKDLLTLVTISFHCLITLKLGQIIY